MQVFDLMKKYNIKPRREAGQNFLIDNNILDKIEQAANLSPDDNVLEVGPGLGVLTERLLKKAKKVFAVELDKSLHYVLKKEFQGKQNFILRQDDILDLHQDDLQNIFDNEPYKIVANIPYNITSVFLRKFMQQFSYNPDYMVLLVQKEVAQRIKAKPGQMSLLAISVQFFSEPQIVDYVSKNCFYPKPAIDSAIIKLKMKKSQMTDEQIKKYFRLVKIGFSAKRKQLQNNLANGLGVDRQEIKETLISVGLKETARAQELSLADWQKLLEKLG